MNETQKLVVLNGLLSIILYRTFENLEQYNFLFMIPGEVYESGKVKQSNLQSQVLTVVGLNYCKVPRVSGIQYYSAIGQFIHVFSQYTHL
jgi:hypothetical protein